MSRARRRSRRGILVAAAALLLAGVCVTALRVGARAGSIGVPAAAETIADTTMQLDDPAVWVDSTDAARSLVICADTRIGLRVFDLAGRQIQELRIGAQSHVDLRQGLRGEHETVVVSGDVARRRALFFTLNEERRRVFPAPGDGIPVGVIPDGLCLYRSARSGRTYLFVLGARSEGADTGWVEQYEFDLTPERSPRGARLVREFDVGTAIEGCVADDDTGALYLAEESVGIWRYPAEPDDATQRVLVDSLADAVNAGGHLSGTVEGIALFRLDESRGYLIASNSGQDDFAVYRREGTNQYVNRFSLVHAGYVDAVSDTEGLEVVSGDLGGSFAGGMLVAQDAHDDNGTPNLKLVSWRSVADALDLR